MTVVADAGPLIALAKVDGLHLLFTLFSEVLIPPAVRTEAVTAGEQRNEPDASLLAEQLETGALKVVAPTGPLSSTPLGLGERQAIGLAVELGADWLLADDLKARHLAEETFQSAGVQTGVKGTLGVIISALSGAERVFTRRLATGRDDREAAGHLGQPEALPTGGGSSSLVLRSQQPVPSCPQER